MSMEIAPQVWDWKRLVWLAVLVAASIGSTLAVACAVPFAGLCAAAACTLPRRDAFYLAGGVWLASQAVGFLFLSYPWDAACAVWGAVLGLTAMLVTGAALGTLQLLADRPAGLRYVAAFVAAIAVYEVTLIAFSFWLGGLENYTLATQSLILGINIIACVGMFALHRIGVALGLAAENAQALSVATVHPLAVER